VPTLAESSVTGVDLRLWYGLVLPAKTPSSVVARLNKELTEVIKGGEFRTFVENLGGAVIPGSPKDMSQRIQSDTEAIRSLVKRINFRVED
jgi:tripartite-type tricarboxylate transporter receptor subunit TctC